MLPLSELDMAEVILMKHLMITLMELQQQASILVFIGLAMLLMMKWQPMRQITVMIL